MPPISTNVFFHQKHIPFGRWAYPRWRRIMNSKMYEGKELYFLGNSGFTL